MSATQSKTDGDLLAEFADDGRQQAFTELVHRHGAMVHGVCLRVLEDHHEAQDAAQAVFVTLARKASALRRDRSLHGWLHRVAVCVARDLRSSRLSRLHREDKAMQDAASSETATIDRRAFQAELDAAINQLPDRYRLPLTAFHLEGRSLAETAQILGLSQSTTGNRLARGRELLRKKLVRRGVTIGSVGALTALLSAESGAAVLPANFVASTVGAATGGAVSTTVAALTKGALHMLFIAKVQTVSLTAAACLVVAGTGIVVAKQLPIKRTPQAGVVELAQVQPAPAPSPTPVVQAQPSAGKVPAPVPPPNTGGVLCGRPECHRRYNLANCIYDCPNCRQQKTNCAHKYCAVCARDLGVCMVCGQSRFTKVAAAEADGDGAPVPGAFKPIDATKPGTYRDGKWAYHYSVVAEGPQKGYRQGFLWYGSADLMDPEPGTYILTPWGWMQWQDRPTRGNWLPVAEKPSKGKQLPDPAVDPSIVSRPPPTPK